MTSTRRIRSTVFAAAIGKAVCMGLAGLAAIQIVAKMLASEFVK